MDSSVLGSSGISVAHSVVNYGVGNVMNEAN